MKQPLSYLRLVLPVTALLLCGLPSGAVTFTSDTAISFSNTNYDDADIVVTNCTLTVDGLHSFASLQVLNGGRLTHTFAANGYLQDRYTVTNEQQVLSATNLATLSNTNVVLASIVVRDFAGLVTYTAGGDYLAWLDANGVATLLLPPGSTIAEGSTNLVSYDVLGTAVAAGLSLTVTGDVFVAQGGTINADGKGYDGALGPGAGRSAGSPLSGSGAGHGGYGGQSAALDGTGPVYDSIQAPGSLGSGGGRGYGGVGGAGGGSVKLVVGGNIRVDGAVSVNGANGINNRSGGGSGGSIWLTCQNLSGAGVLSANGGAGEPSQGGGGAGGRISLQFATDIFTGLTPARGGSGYTRGGAGTVYTRAYGQSAGQVLVDNGGRSGMNTLLTAGEPFGLTAQGGAIVSLDGSPTFANLLVTSNAWISVSNRSVTVMVTGNATIQAGGGIIADSAGYAGGQGPGVGRTDSMVHTGGGGGYGGYGAAGGGITAYGGNSYGSLTAPVEFGSGGGSYYYPMLAGPGGGAIRLNVTGMLVLDGTISADGGLALSEGSGGGAGGSVWLTVGTLTGGGTISANGGMGNGFGLYGGGGGGGGRIAVQYGTDLFFGVTSARGGRGSAWGGAGTIYTKANSQSWGQVLADNGGQAGTNTTWTSSGTLDLTVRNGAVVSPPSSQVIGTLVVASNGWVSVVNQLLNVTGNATIQAGGGIVADGKGNAAGAGPGAGRYYYSSTYGYIGGGGGYGGYGAAGGAPSGYSAYGGITYGSVTAPVDLGSGGGSYYYGSGAGGSGGGAIRLSVAGVLQVDGRISSVGGAALSPSGGGGSGGTISLTVGTLSGGGIISANGGVGNSLGGGGGGGRIAIMYAAYNFSGAVSAYGGGGYAWGGAGTIYTRATSQPLGQLVADNGGQAGTNTTWTSTGPLEVVVRNGAVVTMPGSQPINGLLVASNGWVSLPNQPFSVTGNATIQAGGGIIADGMGFPAGLGSGAGKAYSGSLSVIGGGGGYGGYGAAGAASSGYSAYGGITYGSVTAPVDMGSGGGSSYSPGRGGAGGGAIRLSVTGVLQVDGRISAAGGAGVSPSGGGGSGGTIALTVGTLTGSGVIAANGGLGNALGGGGGGGRIAILYGVYGFTGVVSAYGGGGYAWGGAGTVYTKANSQPVGLVTLDNGGRSGTNTAWAGSTGPIDLTIRGGAVFAPTYYLVPSISSLLVASNGWLVSASSQGYPAATLNVSSNATIQAGGGIIADGTGNPGGSGTGAGRYASSSSGYIGGGGGYGGYGAEGGAPSGYPAYGGSPYGSVSAPADPGSGGGSYSTYMMGGAGGGAIRLNVTGSMRVDGRISACGLAGNNPSAGGGSGGSIYLTVGTLAGSGVISANGGAGNALGGGGGGGRIAITHSSANTFSGLMSAYGGGGYAWGGAGTIYVRPGTGYGQVVMDNGGQSGTNSSWPSGAMVDIVLKNGAWLTMPSSTTTIAGLLIASNGWLSVVTPAGSGPTLSVSGNATIQAGGGIIADGTGYPAGQGPGAGKYTLPGVGYVGSGGGYGGYGAASGGDKVAPGGNAYGSLTQPSAGSGGGTYASYFMGGAGGGAINLNVTGTLQVDGRISAAGGAGVSGNAGGGSGGGIFLMVGTLSGSGVIAANGGAGNGLGGGGGGGRIAITYTTGAFSGLMSAYGGGGYGWGGAGTIYARGNRQSWGQVLVDNGGRAGTNTTWQSSGTIDLTVTGGAVASPPSAQTLGNLLVTSNGWISVNTQTLTVTSNATVLAGGGILADGTGYPGGQGPGAGKYAYNSSFGYVGGGGGCGGYGAASGGATPAFGGGTYGSATAPVDRGSGGGNYSTSAPGGAGGGAIRMNVNGSLLVNGRISANGGAGLGQGTGGGSGGSVWLTAGTLAGEGTISANGGAGDQLGGGGGGGHVALQYGVNAFGGIVSAYGGGGYAWGGAGTIYTKANSQNMGQMLVDNGGHSGTNTPIPSLSPLDLTVSAGAIAYPSNPFLVLSNLFLNNGGTFTCLPTQTNLDVAVLRNATIDVGGVISVDGKGFGLGAGPGAGLSTNSIGSGAGYGGNGGASSVLPGGGTYGSAQQPVDRGSGGGRGWQGTTGGSEGGGAIRFTVGGALMVNGRLSAGGNTALQDDGGGGSGGSIWLTAGALAGSGTIAADGGAGELYDGGGGGGGRVAIYAPINAFGGPVSAAGGYGLSPGENGSIYSTLTPPAPQVVSLTPTGAVNSAVSSFDILFSTVVNPVSVSAATVGLTAPGGLAVSNLAVSAVSPYLFRVSFPQQTAEGDYVINVGPQVLDLLGQPMSQVYTGAISVVWSLVRGAVTDTNGLPVAGVVLQPDGGIPAAITDTNGIYLLSVPPAGTVQVTPSATGLTLVPSSRTYSDVTGTLAGENYLAVSTAVPALSTRVETNTYILGWYGIPGVNYQALYSTNLVEWLPYGSVLPGTNGPLQLLVPMDAEPIGFFRVGASY